tara:strand:+ start:76 stop:477 length:402 start_codon:yes stop_codon:yes gene_type:complete
MMSFTESIGTCFSKYGVANGRASRSEYWWFSLFLLIISLVTVFADAFLFTDLVLEDGFFPINTVAGLATLIPSIAVYIRRLHDVNRSGWWMFIALTCVGIIPLLIWLCSKGTDGPNDFGDDPLQEGGANAIAN